MRYLIGTIRRMLRPSFPVSATDGQYIRSGPTNWKWQITEAGKQALDAQKPAGYKADGLWFKNYHYHPVS